MVGMVGFSGYMGGQDQEPRLVRNNKMSWTTSERILLLWKRVYRVGESHSYILDIFCPPEDFRSLLWRGPCGLAWWRAWRVA
jgi:hypothetical protein